jgi:hypothetical protein
MQRPTPKIPPLTSKNGASYGASALLSGSNSYRWAHEWLVG